MKSYAFMVCLVTNIGLEDVIEIFKKRDKNAVMFKHLCHILKLVLIVSGAR